MNKTTRHTQAAGAALVALALLTLLPRSAQAQEGNAWTEQEVVRAVVARSPEVRASLLDLERADLAVIREEETFTTNFNASLGYTDGSRASLTPTGIRLINNASTSSSLGLTRTFGTGTQVSLTNNIDRSVQDSAATGLLGTTWGVDFRLTLTQPLLRGFGADINEARIRSSQLTANASISTRDRTASALLREVVTAWWELWYAEQNLAIQQQAREVAQQSLTIGEQRVAAGVIAPDDLLPLLTEIASSDESIVSAQAAIRERSIALSRRLGLPLNGPLLRAADAQPTLRDPGDLAGLEDRVEAGAPELRELQATLDSARIDNVLARDQQRARLDASAWAQVSGIGDDVSSALDQLATLDSNTVFVGLTFQMPLSSAALQAESQRSALAIETAEARLQSERERLRADAATQANTLRAAHQRLDLADRTADLSRRSTQLQQKRFEAGTGTALEIVRSLQQQRESQLRAVRVRVDIVNAQLAVDHLGGDLLRRLNVDLNAADPHAR